MSPAMFSIVKPSVAADPAPSAKPVGLFRPAVASLIGARRRREP
jgi:MYXO-CTERM domain-containing protein